MENHILHLSLEQKKHGAYVTIACNQGDTSLLESNFFLVLPSINLKKIRPQIIRDFFFYSNLYIKFLFFKKIKYEILHIHGDWSAFLLGRFIALKTSTKVKVASIHGEVNTGFIWKKIYKFTLSSYSIIYCTGFKEVNFLRSIGLKNVYWQSSGIRDEFSNHLDMLVSPPKYDVITVGSLFPVKNFDLFLDVAKSATTYKFAIVGKGPLEHKLKEKCASENIYNVDFFGHLDAQQLVNLLKSSKVFLSTSISEGTPTVILEAMALGLPIIATQSNDYSNLIQVDKNGYIVDFSSKEIVNTLDSLLNDEEKYNFIKQNNINKSADFKWSNVAKKISHLMRNQLNLSNGKKNGRA